jgi:hypothetical protein
MYGARPWLRRGRRNPRHPLNLNPHSEIRIPQWIVAVTELRE